MNSEEIFRETLEAMAGEGNERAALALLLAGKAKPTGTSNANVHLKNAQVHLHNALRQNSSAWSGATDSHIFAAEKSITEALICIK